MRTEPIRIVAKVYRGVEVSSRKKEREREREREREKERGTRDRFAQERKN